MELVLFLLRVLVALLLLSFLGAMLLLLLREPNQRAINTPTTPTPAKLIGLDAEQSPAQTFDLTRVTWVGRDPNSLIYVDDARVSARHAQIIWDDNAGAWYIEDNASRNGTRVNDARVVRHQLVDGDVIEVGGAKFAFTQP